MATTIITKNGSGAPLAGDLTAGELAVDLTNKRLYSKDSGGTVIELGTTPSSFTSVGIDDNATSTAITIDSSENVGIGGTPSNNSGYTTLTLNGDTSGAVLEWENNGTRDALIYQNGSNDLVIQSESTKELVFNTSGGNERMRIDSSGNVGIGETTPNAKLEVNGGSADYTSSATGTGLFHVSGGATSEYSMYVGVADQGVQIGHNGGGSRFLSFETNETERMRIDSSGNLLVGTTSSVANVGGLSVDATGSFHCASFQSGGNGYGIVLRNSGGTNVGSIAMAASATTFNTSSDQRLKENIVDAPAGNIDAIRVRSFDWKADGSHQTYGMVAQELVEVAPEAVTQGQTEDDMWGVDYSKLVPMMIKEIQDLKAEVAALKGAN